PRAPATESRGERADGEDRRGIARCDAECGVRGRAARRAYRRGDLCIGGREREPWREGGFSQELHRGKHRREFVNRRRRAQWTSPGLRCEARVVRDRTAASLTCRAYASVCDLPRICADLGPDTVSPVRAVRCDIARPGIPALQTRRASLLAPRRRRYRIYGQGPRRNGFLSTDVADRGGRALFLIGKLAARRRVYPVLVTVWLRRALFTRRDRRNARLGEGDLAVLSEKGKVPEVVCREKGTAGRVAGV